MKKHLKRWLDFFLNSFQSPLITAEQLLAEAELHEAKKKVGRPRKDKALRRNVEYQSLMKQRRRLERKSHINGNKPVDQPTEVKYYRVCKRIDEIRESYGYKPRT